jgi:hypothetical protein
LGMTASSTPRRTRESWVALPASDRTVFRASYLFIFRIYYLSGLYDTNTVLACNTTMFLVGWSATSLRVTFLNGRC